MGEYRKLDTGKCSIALQIWNAQPNEAMLHYCFYWKTFLFGLQGLFSPWNTGKLHMRSFSASYRCLEKEVSFWIFITLVIPKTTITCLTVGCDLIFVKKCLYKTFLKWSFSRTERGKYDAANTEECECNLHRFCPMLKYFSITAKEPSLELPSSTVS